jgi:hypothetical protein
MKLRETLVVFLNILLLTVFLLSIQTIRIYATSATAITTAVSSTASNWDPQRKLFAVSESVTVYQFAFFANSSGSYYCTSTNAGASWSSPTSAFSGVKKAEGFSVRYRNYGSTDYVYFAYSDNNLAGGAQINFSRGSISGSTITWGTQYIVQASDYSSRLGNPDVECATDGRVFVAFSDGKSTGPDYVLSCRINNNPNNDGSGLWGSTTEDYKLGIGNTDAIWIGLTRLSGTNGTAKVYAAWMGDDLSAFEGMLWNGSSWGTLETVTTDTLGTGYFSLVSYGNTTYAMFVNSTTTYNPVFNIRSLNNPFWGKELSASSDTVASVSLCVNQTNGDVWGIWGNTINTAIDYAQYNGTWQATQTLYNESAGGYSINSPTIMTYCDVVSNNVGVMWCESLPTDHYLKYLGLSVVPTADVTSPTFSAVSYDSTSAGAPCVLTCLWRDDGNISGFIEGNNNSGTWVNSTWSSVWSSWADSRSAWTSVTLTLNATYNCVVQYEFWANDTSNNWNNTQIWNLTTSATLIDSNPTTNTYEMLIYGLHPSNESGIYSDIGQSFTTLSSSYKITSAVFIGEKVGNPTGTAYAVLYAQSGVYGNSSVPTGPPLATSNGLNMSSLPSSWANITFTFNASQQYLLQPNAHYCIDLQNPSTGTLDSGNLIYWRNDIGFVSPDPTHSGNVFTYDAPGWTGYPDGDLGFYVYGVNNSPSPPLSNVFELVLFIAFGAVFVYIFANLILKVKKRLKNRRALQKTCGKREERELRRYSN